MSTSLDLLHMTSQNVSRFFLKTLVNYGTLTTEIVLQLPLILTSVPAFSWKDKVNISDFHFIASKSGRYFYSIEDEWVVLIIAVLFAGYQLTNKR